MSNPTDRALPPISLFVAMFVLNVGFAMNGSADDGRANRDPERPDPDWVLNAIEDSEPAVRERAARAIAKWHGHVPGAVFCLRRLAHDDAPPVVVAAITAASEIGSRDAFLAVVDALQRDFQGDSLADVVDALDRRDFRRFWKDSDEFGVGERIESMLNRRSRPHRIEDLRNIEFPEPDRRVIESGRDVFVAADCASCHQVAGYGQDAMDVKLKGVGGCYDNFDLARHILQPSLDIHDAGRFEQFLLTDGRMMVGRVAKERHEEGSVRIGLQTNPKNPNVLHWFDASAIELHKPSDVSPMPTGLLDRWTPTQIADLVIFLRTDGGGIEMPSTDHDHD